MQGGMWSGIAIDDRQNKTAQIGSEELLGKSTSDQESVLNVQFFNRPLMGGG